MEVLIAEDFTLLPFSGVADLVPVGIPVPVSGDLLAVSGDLAVVVVSMAVALVEVGIRLFGALIYSTFAIL